MSNYVPIMECYDTFQGEGHYTGTAAWFLRLQGCDVGCVWCDVKESWDLDIDTQEDIQDILTKLQTLPLTDVVITGGEPTLFDLGPLTKLLHQHGYTLHLETSGTQEIMGDFDWITLSPKKFKPTLEENYLKADELKIVIYNPSDLDWAEEHASQVTTDCKLYLQPEWSRQEERVPDILEYIKNHPQWKMSLQTHKYVHQP